MLQSTFYFKIRMPQINLTIKINAPLERCFDLARSIEFHSASMNKTRERAISGITKGLIDKNETVTWEAVHFGIKQNLTSKITELITNKTFTDEMVNGAFKKIHHIHTFEFENGITTMKDQFYYEVPFGFIGNIFNYYMLENYMKRILSERNIKLKFAAESDEWEKYLK